MSQIYVYKSFYIFVNVNILAKTTIMHFQTFCLKVIFRAWIHGPVVREVYDAYKFFEKNPISMTKELDAVDINKKVIGEHGDSVIESICLEYSGISTYNMVEETHRPDGAWYKTRQSGGGIIPKQLILNEYKIINS